MKELLLGLSLLLVSCAQEPQSLDGQPLALANLQSRLEPDGRRLWTSEGRPVSGPAMEEYDNGMRLETYLLDGYENGTHRLYSRDGVLIRVVPIVFGREHGLMVMWRSDGRPYVLEYNEHGEPSGPQLRWASDGRLERNEFVVGGKDIGWSAASLDGWTPAGTNDPESHAALWRSYAQAQPGNAAAALAEVTARLTHGHSTPLNRQ